MEIRKATEADVDAVHGIAEAMLLEHQKAPEQSGFLISNFTKKQYISFCQSADYFWVATEENRVVAFLLAYSSTKIEPEEITNNCLKYNVIDDFMLIKQICSDGSVKGAAYKLYAKLFAEMPQKYALAAVVNEPLNSRSIQFHQRAGFDFFTDITPPADKDGIVRTRSIWCYSKDNSYPPVRVPFIESESQVSQLIEHSQSVSDLYTHEDNLNWTKLGMLVSFMTALLTAFAFLLEKGNNDTNKIIVAVLIFFGLVINLLFRNKIRSGLFYFSEHKKKLTIMDQRIQSRTSSIPSLLSSEIMPKSTTTKLMAHLPSISLLLWVACSFALIRKFFL